METVFATHSGCVRNTCVVTSRKMKQKHESAHHDEHADAASGQSGLGGQLGKLFAAVNIVGWNHHQVPADERVPIQEK